MDQSEVSKLPSHIHIDENAALLRDRFAAAQGKFSRLGFEGRGRASDAYLAALREANAFDGEHLPRSAEDFLRSSYSQYVPFHGIGHASVMLLDALRFARESRNARLRGLPLAVLCHDAGHNGNGRESPESMSLQLGIDWMEREMGWFEQRFPGFSPEELLSGAIIATQYPYAKPSATLLEIWLRWHDTARIATGASGYCLGNQVWRMGTLYEVSALHVHLWEAMGMCLELLPEEGEAPTDYLLRWLERGQIGFFLARVAGDQRMGNFYPPTCGDTQTLAMAERLMDLLNKPEQVAELLRFWCTNCTYPEFVRRATDLGI